MNRGRLIALDTPRALRGSMRRPVLEIRSADGPRAATALAGREGILEAGMFGRHAHAIVRDADEAARLVPRVLAEAGVTLLGMTVIEPSLEDVFIARIKEQGGAPAE
jgi:ABC-2 type transport system ATP-binding protein